MDKTQPKDEENATLPHPIPIAKGETEDVYTREQSNK
jgi:hypothetical protein